MDAVQALEYLAFNADIGSLGEDSFSSPKEEELH